MILHNACFFVKCCYVQTNGCWLPFLVWSNCFWWSLSKCWYDIIQMSEIIARTRRNASCIFLKQILGRDSCDLVWWNVGKHDQLTAPFNLLNFDHATPKYSRNPRSIIIFTNQARNAAIYDSTTTNHFTKLLDSWLLSPPTRTRNVYYRGGG